jgi:uncharacterized protein (TIGR03083 family)
MEPLDHLAHLRAEGAQLVAAAEAAGLDAAVPTCPGWTVADLLVHIAKVFRRTAYALRSGTTERPPGRAWNMEAPPLEAVTAWYDRELAEVTAGLAAARPEDPVWTFLPADQTAGFWRRRLAHEASIHRVDAEAAAGDVGPLPTALAVDGIDELLDVFLVPGFGPDGLEGPPATVHLHATDVEGEWLVSLDGDGLRWERGHAKGDAAVRGAATDLALWLWGRSTGERLERFGDGAALERLRSAASEVT